MPYFSWGLLSIIGVTALAALTGGLANGRESGIWANLAALVWASPDDNRMDWNTPLWFLPALFLLAVASYPLVVLDRRVGRGRVVLWMAAVLAGAGAAAWTSVGHVDGLPFAADSALALAPWYLAGAAAGPTVRKTRPPARRRGAWWAGAAALLGASVWCYLSASTPPDYTVPSTGEPWLYYPGAAAGIVGWCLVAMLWSPRWGVELGRRSLAILVTHRPILGVLQVAVPVTAVHLVGAGTPIDVGVAAAVLVVVVLIAGSSSTSSCGRDCRGCSA